MAENSLEKTDVFQFMVIRAPNSVAPKPSQRNYIKDEVIDREGRREADLFSAGSESQIGKLVYQKVFCENPPIDFSTDFQPERMSDADILSPLFETLTSFEPPCPNPKMGEMEMLRDHAHFFAGGRFYMIPDRLQDQQAPLVPFLLEVVEILRSPLKREDGKERWDKDDLLSRLRIVFDGRQLQDVVFDTERGTHSKDFAATKRRLFDTLYLLYIMRRVISVNLEHVIQGLQALHVLEALAIDEFVSGLKSQGATNPREGRLLEALQEIFPSLNRWSFKHFPEGMPLIDSLDDLNDYFTATPIVHPIFARLHRFKTPFNMLVRPLGVGDLKVVKQWLCGYKAGDFAHVENVLEGEKKTRVHRHLERSEDVLSFSSESTTETQRDTQTADRFELKREVDSVLVQYLSVNAGANVTYNGGTVVANVAAGMAYTRSQTDQNKAANNFSREVMDKAVKRVESKASQQRSTTKIFETEETNTHELNNPAGKGHISGIYRWLDKEYRAQLYNYGKRLMFEFIVPEPAAFLVEARLNAYEQQLEMPRPPQPVHPNVAKLDFAPKDINLVKFNDLRLHYDLTDLSYPIDKKTVTFKDPTTNQAFFEVANAQAKFWVTKSYACDLQSKGYDITKLVIEGSMDFSGGPANPPIPDDLHKLFGLSLNGTQVFFANYDIPFTAFHAIHTPNTNPFDLGLNQNFTPYHLLTDVVDLVIGFQNVVHYSLEISAHLKFSDAALAEWQQLVYERVFKIEQKRIDEADQAAQQAYQAQLTTYHNRLAELRATAINDLLQGQSDAFNRQLITTELKRLCLALLTKELSADQADDSLTKVETMGARAINSSFREFEVKEEMDKADPTQPVSVAIDFKAIEKQVVFPVPKLREGWLKGRYIQFLEQAFDWQQLSYVFYPYFWATPPKWIDLMSRQDQTDPALTAFLQAGSCKVLLACMPAYDEAVLHYLATGEPWEGGPAPVIGDPLYVPLYEELHRQQDDLQGAVPEGPSWKFTVPTSLVYLENSSTPLPKSVCEDTP